MFKNEFELPVILVFLLGAKDSERGAPYFTQTKPKINRVCFLSDFRSLNKQLKRKLYTMTNTNEMLLKLEGSHYDM